MQHSRKSKAIVRNKWLLATTLAISLVLSACSSNNGNAPQTSTGGGTDEKPASEVSIMTVDSPYIAKNYDQNLPVFQEIEKNLNLKLKWTLLPNAGYEDAVSIKLSAGVDMPDVFASWLQNPEELGRNGAVIALNDYFETTMPNVKKEIDSNPVLKSAVTSPDGNIYFLPMVNKPVNMGWLIRQDWLDALDLDMPETTEELYEVLKAFRERDPNGNNQQDEVPMAINYVNYTWFYLMHAFGINTAQPWDYLGQEKDGSFYVNLTRPEFKETMEYLSKLYAEKLLNQDILNVSHEGYTKIINENKVGIIFGTMDPEFLDSMKAANPGLDPKWTVMLPPKGPRGDRGIRSYSYLDGFYFISKNAKDLDAATRFIDYIYADPEGTDLVNWGVKDLSYTEVNGEKQSTDFVLNNPDGMTPNDALRSIGVWPILPFVDRYAHPAMIAKINEDNPWITEGIELYAREKVVGDPEARYRYTAEESAQIAEIHTQLDTYISETLAKVLVGNKPIDEIDVMVDTLNEKGIQRMAEIYEVIHERSK